MNDGAGAFVWRVDASEVGHLVGRMFDGARDGVLVVISPASDTHQTRVEPHELAAMLPPGSEIAELTSMDASVRLSAMVDPAFQCYGGGVRVVLPDASRSDHWRRHRLFTIYPGDNPQQACQRIAAFAEEASWAQSAAPGRPDAMKALSSEQAAVLVLFAESLNDPPELPDPDELPLREEQPIPEPPTPAVVTGVEQATEALDGHRSHAHAESDQLALGELSILLDAQTSAIIAAVRRVVDDDVLGVLDLQGSAARQRSRADAVEEQLAELQRRYDELLERDRDVPVVYLDAEKQFRWEVEQEWLTGTPEIERQALRGYTVRQSFLENLDAQIVPRRKAILVAIDVLTKQVWTRRKCHQFNDAARGGTQRVRDDGAAAWRAYIKAESPGAPRLTWWELADGSVELEHVGHHDDLV